MAEEPRPAIMLNGFKDTLSAFDVVSLTVSIKELFSLLFQAVVLETLRLKDVVSLKLEF